MKAYLKYTILVLSCLFMVFIVNISWFKPFWIEHFFYREFLSGLKHNPQLATKVKVPVLWYIYKDVLNDMSVEEVENNKTRILKSQRILERYRDRFLSDENIKSKKVISWYLRDEKDGIPFSYHSYLINPYNGIQNSLPSYMDTYHYIDGNSDAAAYINRLYGFEKYFRQVLERISLSTRKGIIPPRIIINKSLAEMNAFIDQPANDNILYTSFSNKLASCDKINDREKYLKQAEEAISTVVYPAYNMLIRYFKDLKEIADDDVGAWKLPEGEAYYRYMLRHHTSLDIGPDSIHQLGLKEMSRIKNEIIGELEKLPEVGTFTNPVVALSSLAKKNRFHYDSSIEGRAKCLADYSAILDDVKKYLDVWFYRKPKAGLDIKRVPEFKEKGSSFAYYEVAPIDGSKNASFYVRLDKLEKTTKFDMPTLAYHEGIPGHHFQLSYLLEDKLIPIYRKPYHNSAYIEGWALYAERLAWEYGLYKDDPYGNLGRLKAELVRAVRLIVDTGIHHKRWSRGKAIDFMIKHTGMNRAEIVSEIDRYIVDPGKACAYEIGMLKILELRQKAKNILKDKFDIRDFHRALLEEGMVPLNILEEQIDLYIQEQSGH